MGLPKIGWRVRAVRRSGKWRWSGKSLFRFTQNTERFRWSGTCRRCRRFQSAAAADKIGHDGEMPDVRSLRIPLKYLANLLTAGKEEPIALGLERMLAMRAYMRSKTIDGVIDENIAKRVGLTALAIEDMYQTMAIANYEDRFVIPTAHREINEDAYDLRGSCGFSFGNGCSGGATETNLFGTPKRAETPMEVM